MCWWDAVLWGEWDFLVKCWVLTRPTPWVCSPTAGPGPSLAAWMQLRLHTVPVSPTQSHLLASSFLAYRERPGRATHNLLDFHSHSRGVYSCLTPNPFRKLWSLCTEDEAFIGKACLGRVFLKDPSTPLNFLSFAALGIEPRAFARSCTVSPAWTCGLPAIVSWSDKILGMYQKILKLKTLSHQREALYRQKLWGSNVQQVKTA